MRKRMEELEGLPPEKVNPFWWAFSWLIFWGAIWFCIYWVFAWGATNSGETMNLWGSGYGVAVVQDVMVCECIKLLVMFCLAPMNARPQLQVIRRVINDAALTFVQQGAGDDHDVRVVQHFSPACRAAHLGGVNTLAAAAILRSLTDADLERCRAFKNFTVSMILLGFIIFFAVVALSGEAFFDQLVDVINTVCWNGFVMANSVFYTSTPSGLIILYIVTGSCVLYYFGVFTPSIEKIRDLYAQYSRNHGASYAHVSGPSQHIAGRLPPTSVLLHKRSKAHLKREGRVQTWDQEWHRFRFVAWMRFMAEFQTWNLVIVGEHWAIERRRLREFGEIWSRMNKGTAVQGMTGSIDEGHADNGDERSITPDNKQRNTKSKILIRPKSHGMLKDALQQVGPVDLPESILNMRSSGLKIKLNTVEGLLDEKKRAEKLFGAMNSAVRALESDERVVYTNKAPFDLPTNPELDITTDPKRALRRMLMMLKVNRHLGHTGASNLLLVRRQTNNSGQSAEVIATAAFNALHIGSHNGEGQHHYHHQQQKQQPHKQGRRRRLSSVHPTHEDNHPSSNTSAVDVEEMHSGDAHVLMCELSVSLSWIWESFWPGGGPLSKTEQAEVMERFDDWSKAMQAMRAQSGTADGFEWHPEQDYGTTFSIFAGWFLVLTSYLCKLREVSGVDLEDLDNGDVDYDDDEMLRTRMIRTKESITARHRALRERFLSRRIQCYDAIASNKSTGTNDGHENLLIMLPQNVGKTKRTSSVQSRVDDDLIVVDAFDKHNEAEDYKDDNTSEQNDKKLRLRVKFLKRRVQSYVLPAGEVDGEESKNSVSARKPLQQDLHEAIKDAYFGQTQAAPEPFDFMIGRVEDINKDVIVREKVHIKTMERFLRRRVQMYESPASEKSFT